MSISGTWWNELGSQLQLTDDGKGIVTGTYVSNVGVPAGDSFSLLGSYDPTVTWPSVPMPIGWSVGWIGYASVTTWCGLLFADNSLRATWILTVANPTEQWWQSMNVGMDTFTQTQPSKAEVQVRMLTHGASHPLHEKRS